MSEPAGSRAGRCPRGEELSALIDQAVDAERRDRLHAHLGRCAACRDEVASLRRLRALITADRRPAPPGDLSARLAQIAGAERHEPLWTRPFDPRAARSRGTLPSRARAVRRALTGAVGLASVLVLLVGAGWLAAPPVQMIGLDPEPGGRAELAGAVNDLPLGGDVVGVLLDHREEASFATDAPAPLPAAVGGQEFSAAQVRGRWAKALSARGRLAVTGRQVAWVGHDGRARTARVDLSAQPGQGSEIVLRDRTGAAVTQGYLPAPHDDVDLGAAYRLSGRRGVAVVAGRRADLLEARRDGVLVARWWVDAATGVVLWRARYDAAGRVLASSGFENVRIEPTGFVAHLPRRLVPAPPTQELPRGQLAQLSASGWNCAPTLAGLTLVRATRDADHVHTVYSDGVSTVIVTQRDGALAGAPAGYAWDAGRRVYRGPASDLTWQSGRKVLSVIAYGGDDLAGRVAGELPHDAPVLRGRNERVLAGWRHLMGLQ